SAWSKVCAQSSSNCAAPACASWRCRNKWSLPLSSTSRILIGCFAMLARSDMESALCHSPAAFAPNPLPDRRLAPGLTRRQTSRDACHGNSLPQPFPIPHSAVRVPRLFKVRPIGLPHVSLPDERLVHAERRAQCLRRVRPTRKLHV